MTLTDEELEKFLDDVGVFANETLEPIVNQMEKPELFLPRERVAQPNHFLITCGICLAFFIGLSLGLFLNREDSGPQFTYIIQKLNELEESKDLIEPLDEKGFLEYPYIKTLNGSL